jgi:exopolysaccharide production protein ExoQ
MSRKLNITEKFLAISGMLFFSGVTGGSLTILLPMGMVNLLLRYGVLFGCLVLLGLRWRATLYTIQKSFWIWILLGLMFASLFWSLNPNETFTQLRADLFPMTLFSLYLASRFSLDEQLEMVSITLGIGLLLSVFVGLTMPKIGLHQPGEPYAGAWRGIYSGKNVFGETSVLTANALFLRALFAKRNHFRAWGLFGLPIAALLLSTSKTALVLSFITLLITFFIHRFRWRGKKTVLLLDILLLGVGIICAFLINNFQSVMGSLDRGTTLSGRTDIWSYAMERLSQDHFWLGFGRGAFFNTPSNMSLFIAQHSYSVNHAHNGFIEMLLDVGFIGLVLFAICFALLYIKSFQLAYKSKQASALFPITLLNFLVLVNITDSFLAYRTNIVWILFVTLYLSVNKYPFIRLKQNNSQNMSPSLKLNHL